MIRFLIFAIAACACIGCTHVRPWERGKLAHQSMIGEQSSVAAEHVYAVHEGAVGGGAAAESGCGCN
jgi:hypothetical protein